MFLKKQTDAKLIPQEYHFCQARQEIFPGRTKKTCAVATNAKRVQAISPNPSFFSRGIGQMR